MSRLQFEILHRPARTRGKTAPYICRLGLPSIADDRQQMNDGENALTVYIFVFVLDDLYEEGDGEDGISPRE